MDHFKASQDVCIVWANRWLIITVLESSRHTIKHGSKQTWTLLMSFKISIEWWSNLNVEGGRGDDWGKGKGWLLRDQSSSVPRWYKNFLTLLKTTFGNYVKNIYKSDKILEKIVSWYIQQTFPICNPTRPL